MGRLTTPTPTLHWLLQQPGLLVAWKNHKVTLMSGPVERTYNTRTQPEIINLIREAA